MKITKEAEDLFLVEDVLLPLGFAKETRPFTPHATVARVRTEDPSLLACLDTLKDRTYGMCTIAGLKLKKRTLTSKGPIYEDLTGGQMVRRLPLEEEVLTLHLRPTTEERDYIWSVADKLLAAIRESKKAEGMVVGSIARNTWVKGDRDLDVFLLFSPEMSRDALETEGLLLARTIANRFTKAVREKYAEHPYINACIDSVDVDLVPCYNVDSAERIQSAVDRTPFHTRYITDKINGLVDDVLLLKRFTKAGGIYGSDQMTEGFSGYLCDLLVLPLRRDFFLSSQAAAEWRPHIVIDIEHHVAKAFDEPLVVIDPVDRKRNVAAAVSLDRMVEFVELARGYLNARRQIFRAPNTADHLP